MDDPLHGDQTWDDEDATPVGKPSRRRLPTVIVDAVEDFSTDAGKWEWAKRIEARIAVTEAEAKLCADDVRSRAKRWKWIVAGAFPSGGAIVGLLVWAVTQLDARADAAAENRLRIQMLQRHEEKIEVLRLQSAAHSALLGMRAVLSPNP